MRHAAGALALLLLGAAPAPAQPAFEPARCDLPGAGPELEARLSCGTVRVPRSHAHPERGDLRLAVVVVRSAAQPAQPDPVIYVSGGPGNPLTVYAAPQAREPYAPARDLILVDQRGTGRSEPALCPGHDRSLLDATLAIAMGEDPDSQRRREAYAACREEARSRGFELEDFGTRTTAEDLDLVRRALGVARWNVYGESYGTTVAMTLAVLHPETLRSLVLDSIYPPDPLPSGWETVADARSALFAACAAEAACREAYPDLAASYEETLARLRQSPLALPAPPSLRQFGESLRLTAPLFELLASQLLYFPPGQAMLPRVIRATHDGSAEGLGPLLDRLYREGTVLNEAAHASVQCRDRPSLRRPAVGDPVLGRMALNDICGAWSEPGPPPLVPAGSRVPTLILAGRYDPVARPAQAREVAAQIGPAARVIEFPGLGHNVRAFSPCGRRIASDFIEAPERTPDMACVESRPPPRFALPASGAR